MAAIGRGRVAAIVSASAWASSRSRSGGSTTWLIMPSSYARCAEIRSWRPTSAIRITGSAGILRGSPMVS